MVRLVLRVSRLAKLAITVALLGAALAAYGNLRGDSLWNGIGSAMFFTGVIVYVIERFRSLRRPRD